MVGRGIVKVFALKRDRVGLLDDIKVGALVPGAMVDASFVALVLDQLATYLLRRLMVGSPPHFSVLAGPN
jgi:hypothetical protein